MRAPFQVLVFPFRQNNKGEIEFAIFKCSDSAGVYWQTIAGGGEDGETPLQAAKREANEEAGITPSSAYFALDSICSVAKHHFRAPHWPSDLYVVPEYSFAVNGSQSNIRISSEHSDFKWSTYAEARDLLRWDSNRTALWELNERLKANDLKSAR